MTTLPSSLATIVARIAAAATRSGRAASDVSLVAVSKRVPVVRLQEMALAGQLVFGENYLQEGVAKIAALPGVSWHFIGGIQSNKLKPIAELFQVVQTVDRLTIAMGLEHHLAAINKIMPVYVQVNIGREAQKSGALPEEIDDLLLGVARCPHLHLAGLMAMPPYQTEPEASRPFFQEMKALADALWQRGVVSQPLGLSMGMSADFEVAIEEGATLVRVGSALFGERG